MNQFDAPTMPDFPFGGYSSGISAGTGLTVATSTKTRHRHQIDNSITTPVTVPGCTERGPCVVKLRLRDNESIQDAVRRFRKLVEHAGIKKEMRRREYYEKPSDVKRRQRRRAERRARIQGMSNG